MVSVVLLLVVYWLDLLVDLSLLSDAVHDRCDFVVCVLEDFLVDDLRGASPGVSQCLPLLHTFVDPPDHGQFGYEYHRSCHRRYIHLVCLERVLLGRFWDGSFSQ